MLLSSNKENLNMDIRNEEERDLEEIFTTKEISKIIKNQACLFTNEIKEKDDYYFCLCSEEAYFPICRECAFTCHINHNPIIKLNGYFTCMCGQINNHLITDQDNKRFDFKSKEKNPCFFNEFLANSIHKNNDGLNSDNSYCAICLEINCDDNYNLKNENAAEKNEIILKCNEKLNRKCNCGAHNEINVVTFRNEFMKYSSKLNDHLLNFNFNILLVSPTLKNIFINFLNEKLVNLLKIINANTKFNFDNAGITDKTIVKRIKNKENLNESVTPNLNKNNMMRNLNHSEQISNSRNVNENKQRKRSLVLSLSNNKKIKRQQSMDQIINDGILYSEEEIITEKIMIQLNSQVEFFTDYVNNTLFEVFYMFKKNYSSQFLHVKNFVSKQITPQDLLKILSCTLLHHKILENNDKYDLYLNSKISFALVIFNIYIKSHFLNFNNLINLKTILNLNIFQRFIYLFDSKHFYKLSHINDPNNQNKRKDIPFREFNESIVDWENFIFDFAKSLLDILELISLLTQNKSFLNKMIGKTLEPISKIFKFLIKYNLIDNDLKLRYFECLEEILSSLISDFQKLNRQLDQFLIEKNTDFPIYGLPKSEIEKKMKQEDFTYFTDLLSNIDQIKENIWFIFQVIKTIFYFILQNNDQIIIEKLKNREKFLEKNEYFKNNYSFQNEEFNKICKIFISSLFLFTENAYNTHNLESVYKSKILKMDLYIKKILELLIGNNEFYLKSLESLLHKYYKNVDRLFKKDFDKENVNHKKFIEYLNSPYVKNFISKFKLKSVSSLKLLENSDFLNIYSTLRSNFNQITLNKFNAINFEFGIFNKKFYEYEISFEVYINKIFKIFASFEEFIYSFANESNILEKESLNLVLAKQIFKNKNIKNEIFNNNLNENNNNLQNNKTLYGNGYSKIVEDNDDDEANFSFDQNNQKKIVEKNLNLYSNSDGKFNNNKYNIKPSLESKTKIKDHRVNEEQEKLKEDNFFKALSSLKKLKEFKHSIGFTDFFENVNEFLDIYSKTLNFSKELKNLELEKSNIKFFVKFISLFVENNEANISLIMGLNPKKFVDAFYDFKPEIINFIEEIANVISKFDYLDNYYFITDLINYILEKIVIDEKTGISEDDLKIFCTVLKAFKRIFFKYNINNNEIIIAYENIQKKISFLKMNETIINSFENFFKEMKLLNLNDHLIENNNNREHTEINGFEKVIFKDNQNIMNDKIFDDYGNRLNEEKKESENKIIKDQSVELSKNIMILKENKIPIIGKLNEKNIDFKINKENLYSSNQDYYNKISDKITNGIFDLKVYENFFTNYLNILNTAIEKEILYYYDLPDSGKDLFIDILDLKNKISRINSFKMPFRREAEIYLHSINLKKKFTFSDINSKFTEFQNSKIHKRQSKISAKNIEINKSNLDFSYDLLKNQINNFNYYLKFNEGKLIRKYMNKVFSYFEYSIINPLYKLLNLYLAQSKTLIGEDYFKIYELVYIFHFRIFDIYREERNIYGESKRDEIPNIDGYSYSDLKTFLNDRDYEMLETNIEKLKNIQYYQIEALINLFRVTLIIIKKNNLFNKIHLKRSCFKYKIFENSYLDCYDDTTKDKIFENNYKKIIEKTKNSLLDRVEYKFLTIINEFRKNLAECFGNQFSLIKCFEDNEMDLSLNFRHIIIEYLLNKFSDQLTEVNKNQFLPQNKYSLNKHYNDLNNRLITLEICDDNTKYFYRNYILPENLKLQNFYCLFYLRNLFFYDPEKFQIHFLSLMEEQDVFEEIEELNEKNELRNEFISQQKSYCEAEKIKLSEYLKTFNPLEEMKPEIIESLEKIKNYEKNLSNVMQEVENIYNSFDEEQHLKQITAKNKIENFLTIFNKFFIYGPLCLEINKIYEISSEISIINYDINFDFLINSIFFIQNICEGHQKKFQNILYNLRFYPDLNRDSLTKFSISKFKISMQFFNKNLIDSNENQNNKNELYDSTEKKLAKRFLIEAKDLIFSYLNFNFSMLKQILFSVFFDNDSRFVFSYKSFKNNMNLICVYEKISDLIIEMIQGTEEKNLFHFLKPELEENTKPLTNEQQEEYKEYQFLSLIQITKDLFMKPSIERELEIAIIKKMNFSIVNNILNHEYISSFKIKNLQKILDVNLTMTNICYYMNKIVLRYQYETLYEHPHFNFFLNFIDYKVLDDLSIYEKFLKEFSLSKDDYFELCIEMYYYILMMAKNFELDEAQDIINIGLLSSDESDNRFSSTSESLENLLEGISISEYRNDIRLKTNYLENKLNQFYQEKLNKKKLLERIIKNKDSKNKTSRFICNNKTNKIASSGEIKLFGKNSVTSSYQIKKISNNDVTLKNNKIKPNFNKLPFLNSFEISEKDKYFSENQNKYESNDNNLNDDIHFDNCNYPFNFIYVQRLFSRIIQTIEVVFEKNGDLQLKEVYFIKQPEVYILNKENRRHFFSEKCDRTDAISKMNSLFDSIDEFEIELEYKLNNSKSRLKMILIDFNYRNVDFFTLLISLAINLVLFLTLDENNFNFNNRPFLVESTVYILGLIQISINILTLGIFIYSKYNFSFYRVLNKIIYEKFSNLACKEFDKMLIIPKLNKYDLFRVYFLESIILEDDIYFVIYNLILAIIGISNFYATFLFTLQLMTISRFVKSINDIMKAFKSRYKQLLTLVFFLIILISFYTNVGFYFLKSEFDNRGTGHVNDLFIYILENKNLFIIQLFINFRFFLIDFNI